MTISETKHPYQLRFLGNWDLKIAQQSHALGSRKAMALLAYVAVEGEQRHSRDSLLGLFWPEMSDGDARNNLRVVWARLRRTLQKSQAPFNWLKSSRHALWFEPDETVWLDTAVFRHLLTTSNQHAHHARESCPDCQERLAAAAALYRGPFLDGLYVDDCPGFDEWLFVKRNEWQTQVLTILQELAQFHEENGRFITAEQFTRQRLSHDNLQEEAHRQLMRLLYFQDQRSAAVAQYDLCRALLDEQLGVSPDAETQRLLAQIKAKTVPMPQAEDEDRASRQTLPQAATTFIGRDEELTLLSQRLGDPAHRLITISGPGGMGKSRLALQAAHENQHLFREGACFVSLVGVQTAVHIPSAIANALNLPLSGRETPANVVLNALRQQQLLLIIDNLEHLMDGVDFLLEIVEQAPQVTLLVTSRERLRVQAEDLFRLRGLAVPTEAEATVSQTAVIDHYPAVRLFVDRTFRLDKQFKLTPQNAPHIARICRLVEGFPLALELAATWVLDMDLPELAEAISRNVDTLATSYRDVRQAHRSMEAVFNYSWELLNPTERVLLAQLSVFRGGFTAATAKLVGATPVTLAHLRYKSLVNEAGNGRFQIHELLRQYAAVKLGQEPEVETAVYQKHSRHFLQQIADQADALQGATPHLAVQTLRLDLDNIRQAWQWSVTQHNVAELTQAVSGLARFYRRAGLQREGEQVLAQAAQQLEGESATPPHLLASILAERSHLAIEMGDKTSIVQAATQALVLAADDVHLQAYAHTILGWANRLSGELTTARTHLQQALALPTAVEDRHLAAMMFRQLGIIYSHNPDTLSTAFDFYQRGLVAARQVEDRFAEQSVLISMAVDAVDARDFERALSLFKEGLETAVFLQDRTLQCYFNNGLGFTLSSLGMFEKALNYHQNAQHLAHEIANAFQESHALHNLCAIQRKLGNLTLAVAYGREALRVAQSGEMSEVQAYAWLHLGYVFHEQGQLELAMDQFGKALAGWQQLERETLAAEAGIGLAGIYLAQGAAARALQLIEPHLTAVFDHSLDATDEPIQIVLTCYHILASNDDDRAAPLLAQTQKWLQETAVTLSNPTYRHSFLEKIPAHKAILSMG